MGTLTGSRKLTSIPAFINDLTLLTVPYLMADSIKVIDSCTPLMKKKEFYIKYELYHHQAVNIEIGPQFNQQINSFVFLGGGGFMKWRETISVTNAGGGATGR